MSPVLVAGPSRGRRLDLRGAAVEGGGGRAGGAGMPPELELVVLARAVDSAQCTVPLSVCKHLKSVFSLKC